MTGAALHRGTSRQDWGTPVELLRAVEARWGRIDFDLAATPANAVARRFFTEIDDALAHDWYDLCPGGELLWLNPPFANIEPWVKKCAEQVVLGARIACLVPASVGSNWFFNYVWPHAGTHFLNPRLTFVGASDPYPKDCCIALYTPAGYGRNCMPWKWKEVVDSSARV